MDNFDEKVPTGKGEIHLTRLNPKDEKDRKLIGSTDASGRYLISPEFAATPREVVRRWHRGEYLQRQLPSVGYRYCGLFLALCGYYRYKSYKYIEGKPIENSHIGFGRFFLRKGEISFAIARTAKPNFAPSSFAISSLFSSLYEAKNGTQLVMMFQHVESYTSDLNKVGDLDPAAISHLNKLPAERKQRHQADGVFNLNIGDYENGILDEPSSLTELKLTYNHVAVQPQSSEVSAPGNHQ